MGDRRSNRKLGSHKVTITLHPLNRKFDLPENRTPDLGVIFSVRADLAAFLRECHGACGQLEGWAAGRSD